MMKNIERTPDDMANITQNNFHNPYSQPLLEELGDLRTLTLGVSSGIEDDSPTPTYPEKASPF